MNKCFLNEDQGSSSHVLFSCANLGYIGYFACFSFTLSTIFIASIILLSFIDSSLSTGEICGVVIGSVAGVCLFIILPIRLYLKWKEDRVTAL